MDATQFYRRLFDYDLWANRAALESVAALSALNTSGAERARKTLTHVIGAQRIWLSRFETPEHPNVEPWPALSLDECRAAVEDLYRGWTGLVNRLGPEKLAQDLVYRNTKGVEFRTPISDVLMHLVIHSAYHRGQVAAAVREAGVKPASTDYVVWTRQVQSQVSS